MVRRRWFGRRRGVPSAVATPATTDLTFVDRVRAQVGELRSLVKRNGQEIPVHETLVVLRICDQLDELLTHMARSCPSVQEQISVEFMAADYVPDTIDAYLISHDPGRDASLSQQVALMWREVRSMIDAVYRDDDAALSTNQAFLERKFR
ncbi:MAG: hypothetical protein FWH11_06170 [Micrococcales bacterium]|nr:hypothetical protein [Micrococcales bacterium]